MRVCDCRCKRAHSLNIKRKSPDCRADNVKAQRMYTGLGIRCQVLDSTRQENSINSTPSPAYAFVRAALLERRCVSAEYLGFTRLMCPHVIGLKQGKEHALFFQFAGGTTSGTPP